MKTTESPWLARYRQYTGRGEEPVEIKLRQPVAPEDLYPEAQARYGEFLLFLLRQDGYELRTHNVGRFAMDHFGYTPSHWNGIRNRLGSVDRVVVFETETPRLTSRVAVDIPMLRSQIEQPYITPEIIEELGVIQERSSDET